MGWGQHTFRLDGQDDRYFVRITVVTKNEVDICSNRLLTIMRIS